MTSLREAVRHAAEQLRMADIDTAALDARLLMQEVFAFDHAELLRHEDDVLGEEQKKIFENYLARRLAREPLAQITGRREFWRDCFAVSRDVLTPRPDSETLIEAFCEHQPDKNASHTIVDLGCGSGCLLLSLLREYPNARGIGVDVSIAALQIAKRNASDLRLDARSFFIASAWGEALQTRSDMVISNPPYITENEIVSLAPEVKSYEPMMALSGGADGLVAYRELIPRIRQLLKPDGLAVVELGAGQADDVSALARSAALRVVAIRPDLAGVSRAIVINHKQE